MDLDVVQEHRKARLKAAAEKAGGDAALAQLLGYKDGAYVGQMLRGIRPISEKTVAKLESKRGYRNWFAVDGPVEGDEEEMALTTEQREYLRAFEKLSEDGRKLALHDVHTRLAAEIAKHLMEGTLNVTGYASDEKVSKTIKPAPRPKGE